MFHVILHCPEIPPNTGNVIRLCANTGCTLHLVRPLGFALDHKSVQRAGMDYAELAQVRVHDSLDALSGHARAGAGVRHRNRFSDDLRAGAVPAGRCAAVRVRVQRAAGAGSGADRRGADPEHPDAPGQPQPQSQRTRWRSWCTRPGVSSSSRCSRRLSDSFRFGADRPAHQRAHDLLGRQILVEDAVHALTQRHLDTCLALRDSAHGTRRVDALDDLADLRAGLLDAVRPAPATVRSAGCGFDHRCS
jgi:hypothetical protein